MTDQEKMEKVIKGLENIVSDMQEEIDEWHDYSDSELSHGLTCDCEWWYNTAQMLKDALALLKAQEPVKPIPTTDDDWTCGHCGMSLVGYEELDAGGFTTVRHTFCPNCGRAVKWE